MQCRFSCPAIIVAMAALTLSIAGPSDSAAQSSRASYDPALWSGLRYRLLGPLRGGRVTAI